MLPRYIAFKKPFLNYYCIFENVSSGLEDGLPCIKLIPKINSDIEIKSLKYRGLVSYNNVYIRRTTRSEPFYKNHIFEPSCIGYEFKMVYKSEEYCVPIMNLIEDKYLGERWSSLHSDYMYCFEGDLSDINAIKRINLQRSGSIVNYIGGKRIVLNIERSVPDYVIKGWLKSVVGEICPISCDLMELDDICSTPCYHTMSYKMALTWLRRCKSCPVCRKECDVDDLYRF